MVYEILGIERFEGISKKTGKPYDCWADCGTARA